jgi:allantoinase
VQQQRPAAPGPELRLRARRIITPAGERSGVVVARGGVITEITDAGPDPAGEVVVPDDCVLLPGLVDSHVHVNEPGRTQWEGFATATAAAAAGGITTIADMPLNSIPPTVDVASLTVKRAAARGQLSADVAFWGGAVPGNAGDLRALHEAGVAGFKCFLLPSGVPEFPPLDAAGLLAAMTEIAAFGGLLIAHAEDPGVIDAAPAAHGPSYHRFLASRPPGAEVAAVRGLLAATRRTGCRTHIVHLSAAAALPDITRARQDGLPVTVETCPHYLALAAEQVPDGATQFKCCPPVRGAANREQLWQALETGLIDCVVSDHSPCPVADKRLDTGDFGAAWGGIASLELSLPVTWTAAAARGRSLVEVARWMAAAPARLAGLRDRGEIRPGAQADFCVLAPDEEFTVDPARLRQRHPLTPYAGRTLRGVVRQTWLRGEPARRGAGRLVTPAGEEQHG